MNIDYEILQPYFDSLTFEYNSCEGEHMIVVMNDDLLKDKEGVFQYILSIDDFDFGTIFNLEMPDSKSIKDYAIDNTHLWVKHYE